MLPLSSDVRAQLASAMIPLLVLLAGMLFPYVISLFFFRTREARGRFAGTLCGLWIMTCAAAGIGWMIYAAIARGSAGIGRRGTFAMFQFSDSPVLASVALLVNVAMLSCIGAMGWMCYREARSIVVSP